MHRTPADRLKEARITKGFANATDAARAFGWPEVTYRAHENGIRGLRFEAAQRYAQAFGTTANFLLTGQKSGQPAQVVNLVTNLSVIARVAAGAFRYDDADVLEEGAIQVPAVPRRDIPVAAQYAVLVDGPSVNQRIPDGAFAICARYDSYPGGAQHGQLVHVVRERAGLHENTIKELRYTRDGQELWPCSNDQRYQERITLDSGTDGEVVRIVGVVIGQFRPM